MSTKKGLTVIEVVVASAVFAAAVVGIVGAYNYFSRVAYRNTASVQAAFLAEEGVEAVRIMRDSSWTNNIANLSNGVNYRLTWNGTRWGTTTAVSLIDNQFDRTVSFSAVYRDGAFDVVTSGGTLDTGTRKVTVSVAWYLPDIGTSTKTVEAYVSNIFSN